MATYTSKLSQIQLFKRSNSDLHFVSPAGDDFSFETDQPVDTLWAPVIEGDSLGRLSLFHLGDSEMPQVISDNLTGSFCKWYIKSDPNNNDILDGAVYWLSLEVFPDNVTAYSDHLTLQAPTYDTQATSTTETTISSSVYVSDGPTSTQVYTITVVNTPTDVDSLEPTLDPAVAWEQDSSATLHFYEKHYLSIGVRTGIAIGGGILVLSLLTLLGVFIYRQRRSIYGHVGSGEGENAIVRSSPEEPVNGDIAEMESSAPKGHVEGKRRTMSGMHELE